MDVIFENQTKGCVSARNALPDVQMTEQAADFAATPMRAQGRAVIGLRLIVERGTGHSREALERQAKATERARQPVQTVSTGIEIDQMNGTTMDHISHNGAADISPAASGFRWRAAPRSKRSSGQALP